MGYFTLFYQNKLNFDFTAWQDVTDEFLNTFTMTSRIDGALYEDYIATLDSVMSDVELFAKKGDFIRIFNSDDLTDKRSIVIPTKLANGQIQVQIAQSNDRFGSYNRQMVVNGQNLTTSVTLYPNQWTTIGYVNNASQSSGIYGGYSQNLQTPIQIMVR